MRHAEVISRFSGKRVVVVGDIMVDEYVHGDVSRISPEAPVPVMEVRERVFRMGGAANAAANVASLGGRPVLVGLVGNDEAAKTLREMAQTSGVDVSGLVTSASRPTTLKTRVVARGQQIVRLDYESRPPLDASDERGLLDRIAQLLAQADACIVSDYAKGVANDTVCAEAIAIARRLGCPVVVDPKSRSFAKYAGASLLTPNTHELELAAGCTIHGEAELVAVARAQLPTLGGGALLVTRGALGMSLFVPGREPFYLPTAAKAVYDVVGAGDTVVAAAALGLAAGAPLQVVVDVANRAAGVVVSKPGTATVTQAELSDALEG